jgi:hypothetical protein
MAHPHTDLEDAIGDGDVAKVSATLRTAFDVDAGGAEDAVVDGDVLGYAALAEGTAGLEADGVVVRFDEAVGDADVTRAVRVDTVGEAALNADRVDLDKAAADRLML